jgi:hypothetical protein
VIAISELTVVATVTRAGLTPPAAELNIDDGVNFALGRSVRIGAVTWRREVAQSPFVEGRIPVHEVKDSSESSIVVLCLGATHAALQANIGTLLEAFTQQYTYEVRLQIEGSDYHWVCERADYEVGWITETIAARVVPVNLTFHRAPTPVAGVF